MPVRIYATVATAVWHLIGVATEHRKDPPGLCQTLVLFLMIQGGCMVSVDTLSCLGIALDARY